MEIRKLVVEIDTDTFGCLMLYAKTLPNFAETLGEAAANDLIRQVAEAKVEVVG